MLTKDIKGHLTTSSTSLRDPIRIKISSLYRNFLCRGLIYQTRAKQALPLHNPVLNTGVVAVPAEAGITRLSSQSGQALVEMSFVIFMFFAFIFFTLHLTLLSNAKSTLNLATYSACRECIVTKGNKGKVGAAAEAFLNAIREDLDAKQGCYEIKYDSDPSHLAFGDKVKLTMTIYYKPMPIPLMKQFYRLTSTKSIALTSSCGMTME